jgi:phosphate-selective porin OprO/OprP
MSLMFFRISKKRPASRLFSLVGLFILVALTCTGATAADLVVKSVVFPDRDDPEQDVMISVVIKDGILDSITKEEVIPEPGTSVFDGRGGFILGELDTGGAPSFIILSADPRKQFDVLLDTRRYAVFAIKNGEVVRNSLLRDYSGTNKQPRRWLSYTPPPISLPVGYRNQKKWNRFKTDPISGIFASAIILDRQNWLDQDSASEMQVGPLEPFDGGEIRGFRLGFIGTFNFDKPWVYTLFGATNAYDKGFDTETVDDLTFFDWRVDIPFFADTSLSVGKQKEPISLGRLMTGIAPPVVDERPAALDTFLPSRNVGVTLSGTAFDQRTTWAAGVFNDWLDDDGSAGENSTQLVGRVTWIPLISEDESSVLHLGAGYRYSNAKEGGKAGTEPEFNQSPDFVGIDDFLADDTYTYNLEAAYRNGPWMLMGEYINVDVRSPALGDPEFDGYYITGSWVATGEMRPYLKRNGVFHSLPVAKSTSAGGWGAVEFAVRYSHLNLSDNEIDGGVMDIASIGASWWLTRTFAVGAFYRHISLDRGGLDGDSQGFMTRILLILE